MFMKSIQKFILILTFLLIIIDYGENKSEARIESPETTPSIPDKTICELLTKETMSSLTGISFKEESNTLHQTDATTGKYVSQCGYGTDGARIAVMVRRFGNSAFPTEKEKVVGGPKTGDKEMDDMMEKSIQTAKTVSGIGDAAYFYEMGGINNFVVIFQKHYQVRITSYGKGFGFDDATMEISKKVAEKVIEIFK